jgi:hypothetical protein
MRSEILVIVLLLSVATVSSGQADRSLLDGGTDFVEFKMTVELKNSTFSKQASCDMTVQQDVAFAATLQADGATTSAASATVLSNWTCAIVGDSSAPAASSVEDVVKLCSPLLDASGPCRLLFGFNEYTRFGPYLTQQVFKLDVDWTQVRSQQLLIAMRQSSPAQVSTNVMLNDTSNYSYSMHFENGIYLVPHTSALSCASSPQCPVVTNQS